MNQNIIKPRRYFVIVPETFPQDSRPTESDSRLLGYTSPAYFGTKMLAQRSAGLLNTMLKDQPKRVVREWVGVHPQTQKNAHEPRRSKRKPA